MHPEQDKKPALEISRRAFARNALLGVAAASAATLAIKPESVAAGGANSAWRMQGNDDVDSDDFLGTTNSKPLIFKTMGLERMRLHQSGGLMLNGANTTALLALRSSGSQGFMSDFRNESSAVPAVAVQASLSGVNTGSSAVVRAMVMNPQNVNAVALSAEHAGNGTAIRARNNSGTKPTISVENSASGGNGIEVRTPDIGVLADTGGVAIYGYGDVGVYGYAKSANGKGLYAGVPKGGTGYAGYFTGRVWITGSLRVDGTIINAAAARTMIDHPLDPEARTLTHAGLDTPEAKSIYDGVATFDARGRAVVELPAYVSALNHDFRYQLTAIGAPMPRLHVRRELQDGSFEIAGGTPGKRVAWQVTGLRADAFSRANLEPVEADKPAEERGTYLHPEAFGLPAERGLAHRELAAYNPSTMLPAVQLAPAEIEMDNSTLPSE